MVTTYFPFSLHKSKALPLRPPLAAASKAVKSVSSLLSWANQTHFSCATPLASGAMRQSLDKELNNAMMEFKETLADFPVSESDPPVYVYDQNVGSGLLLYLQSKIDKPTMLSADPRTPKISHHQKSAFSLSVVILLSGGLFPWRSLGFGSI